jgi:serine/threonine-protein kinase RsbW
MTQLQKSLSLESSIDQLNEVEALIDSLHESNHIPESVYGNVLVAVTEAFLNAINHGNNQDSTKNTDLDFELDESSLTIKVSDQGAGFDFENLPDPTSPDNLEKTNGRGLFIIKNLADELTFEREGATLVMTFDISPQDLVEA